MFAPVERGRAVVGEHLSGCGLMNGLGELPRFGEIWRRRLAPEEIGVRRVRDGARDGALDAAAETEKTLCRPVAYTELAIARIDVAGEELRAVGIGSRDQHRWHVEHVGGEARRDERANELPRRHEHLAAEVAALLLGRELILEMHTGRAGLDH